MGEPTRQTKLLAACGIVGVAAFVAAWATGSASLGGYSAVQDAISQLAAVDRPTRASMTAGFVAFGLGVPLFAQALRRTLGGWSWVAATTTGLATLGVAATPLGRFDAAHLWFATLGYASLAATPLLAAPTLRARGARLAANWTVVCGVASAALLVASTIDVANGLTQRLGLGLGDLWIVVAALSILGQRRAG